MYRANLNSSCRKPNFGQELMYGFRALGAGTSARARFRPKAATTESDPERHSG